MGPKGVGKSTLIKLWVNNKNLSLSRVRWIAISPLSSLTEFLGDETGGSLEFALDRFAQSWDRFDYIIWDDLHHLSQKQLSLLVSFLKNSFSGPQQILISDENSSLLRLEVPVVMCEPFTANEVGSYVSEFLQIESVEPKAIENLWKRTGGLPLLINLWSQAVGSVESDSSALIFSTMMGEALLSIFSPLEMVQLAYVYFLRKVPIVLVSDLESLYGKFFLLKEQNDYVLHSYLVEIVETYFSSEIKKQGAVKALEKLKELGPYDPFLAWWIGISVGDRDVCDRECVHFGLDKLESLTQKDLTALYVRLRELLHGSSGTISDAFVRHLRLYLQMGILLGERVTSLETLYGFQEKLLTSPETLTEEKSQLIYEIVYWSHRTGNESKGQPYFEFIQNRAKGSLKSLLQLEMAFPFVYSDPKRALTLLTRVIEGLPKDLRATSSEKTPFLKVKAHALFEIAKCKAQLALRQEALMAYEEAEKIYASLGLTYYALFCRTNRIFEFLNDLNVESAFALCADMHPVLARYDYKYLHALNLLAESVVWREKLQLGKALISIEKALQVLPEGAPPKAIQDIYQRKALILLGLGRLQQAQEIYTSKFKQNRSAFMDCLFVDNSIEDAIEKDLNAENQNAEDPDWESLRFLLVYAPFEREISKYPKLEQSEWGRWCLLEHHLAHELRSDHNSDTIKRIAASMAQELERVSDTIPEKIALEILQWQIDNRDFTSQEKNKFQLEELLEKVSVSEFDPLIKNALMNLISILLPPGLREQKLNPLSARQLEPARWQHWIWPVEKNDERQFVLKTCNGENTVETWDDQLTKQFAVVVFDHLGAVFYQQHEVPEFHRKTVLRQILSSLLDHYPHELSKAQLAPVIWGERYSSSQHDPRIYTSIQRLRQLIDTECIESWNGGYRWTSKVPFALIKTAKGEALSAPRVQTLILQALHKFSKSGLQWATRADLVEATQSSESTVKRELSKLLSEGKVQKKGSGPKVFYSLKKSKE